MVLKFPKKIKKKKQICTHLHVFSMSAPYESANPISLSQILMVQVTMLGTGYSTMVWEKERKYLFA